VKQYQILADEGWTHTDNPPNRYHHFFVSLFAPSDTISLLEQKLKECNDNFTHPHKNEIKWSKLNARFFTDYKKLIDTFFDFWQEHDELNHLLVLRLRLYDNVAMLNNYSQGIIIDNPSHYNDNINDIEKLSKLLLEMLSNNNNIPLQKAEN